MTPSLPFPVRALRRLGLSCCLLAAGGMAPAQEPGEPSASTDPATAISAPAQPRLAHSTAEFWALATENADRDLAYDIEADVLYYNAAWGIMWVQSGEVGEYATPRREGHAFRSGDRVRFRGIVPAPVTALDFSGAETSVVGPAHAESRFLDVATADLDPFRNALVHLDAWVDKQDPIDRGFTRLSLSHHGRNIVANVTLTADRPTPDLVDQRIRISGVFAPRQDANGHISELQLMVPGTDRITPLGPVESDPRFQAPRHRIADLPTLPAGQTVRLVGQVVEQNTGHSLALRDRSSQIQVPTTQLRYLSTGQPVELVGRVNHADDQPLLLNVSFHAADESLLQAEAEPDSPVVINLAARVRELSDSESAASPLVRIRGVVTWSHPNATTLFVQDNSGGVEVSRRGTTPILPPGSLVEVHGKVGVGDFAPVIEATEIVHRGALSYPKAPDVSLERALTGAEDAQWITLRGYVYQVSRRDDTCTLRLSSPQGDFQIHLPSQRTRRDLLHAVVEARGVCRTIANDRRQLEQIELWVPEEALVHTLDSAPADPFAPAELPLARLGLFNPGADAINLVNVTGTVLFHRPGQWLYLADGDHVVRIHTRETTTQPRGRRLEVAGRLSRDHGAIVLREALLRPLGQGALPPVRTLGADHAEPAALEGHLTAFTGTLINLLETDNRLRYTVQEGSLVVEAELPHHPVDRPDDSFARPELGSRVRVTGVLVPTQGSIRASAAGLVLQLADPTDVVVLARPSWWTSNRLTQAALLLIFALSLGLLWVRVLRRRVQQQTALIKQQMAREARLSEQLQHATRIESLGLLAGGIAHDFNNLLTVVLGNLSLLRLDTPAGTDAEHSLTDAERAVGRAQQLTLQLLTFAKGGTPVRHAEDLPGIVKEVTHFALHGTGVECDLNVPDNLWPAHVDKGQISQVIQNLVINAMQAMNNDGHLGITLRNVGETDPVPATLPAARYLRLDVSDSGCGIADDKIHRIFDPYFSTKKEGHGLGLATVYSIIRKHHGEIEVNSTPGRGTTFTIWLPAASTPGDSNPPFAPAPEIPRGRGERILVMDDEPGIRSVAAKMLTQLNYTPVTVAEGRAAIEAYTQARADGKPFAAVILDLTVRGGLGGADTLRELRLRDPEAKAIVSSGYSSDQALAAHRELGFNDLIPKPYELARFAAVLANLLAEDPAVPA